MTIFTIPTALSALTMLAAVLTMVSGYQSMPVTTTTTPYLITTSSEIAPELALLNETSSSSSPSAKCNDIYFTVIWFGLVAGTVCAVGMIGNSVSVYVLATDTKTPTASFQLIALAVADNTFLLLWCVHYTVRYLVEVHYGKSTPTLQLIRLYTFPVLYMSQMATIWFTVVIAFNRYMAVCWPYRAPQLHKIDKVRRSIAVVALLSVLLNIPKFFEMTASYALQPAAEFDINTVTTSGETRTTSSNVFKLIINRTEFGSNYYYQKIYCDAFYYLISFALPLLVLVFMNACVIKAYRAARKRRYRMYSARRKTSGQPTTATDSRRSIGSGSQKNSSGSQADHESSVTLVMIVIVLVFVVCQAPARLVQMIWSYKYNGCSVVHYLIHISNTFEVFNSSVNFFIYCAFHRYFRTVIATWSHSVRLLSLRPTPSGAASQFEMAGECGVQATAIELDMGKVNGADEETIVRRQSGGGSDVLILIAVERTVTVDQGGVKSNGVAIEMFELDQTKQRCDEDR